MARVGLIVTKQTKKQPGYVPESEPDPLKIAPARISEPNSYDGT